MSRRSPDPIDTAPFEVIMKEALWAFGTQLDFGVSMATKARVILAKRATHAARTALKIAEAAARTSCEAVDTFTCASTLPCGVGPVCRYSTGLLRELDVPDEPLGPMRGGKLVTRPQPGPDGSHGSYNVESAVYSYRDRLEGSTQPA